MIKKPGEEIHKKNLAGVFARALKLDPFIHIIMMDLLRV
jgi:hypothetical protein